MGTKKITHAEYLQSAFADFEQASSELRTFYASLESRVAELTRALKEAQAAESCERAEKIELAARLSSLLDALPAGVVELAVDGKVAHLNPAAVELLDEVECGEQWSDVVQRAFSPRWDDGHDITLTSGRRVNIETAALSGKAGQILLLKDVTDTRRLQDRLNHHQRLSAKTEVAAALAHQIRTPLSSAMLHLSQLRNLVSGNEQSAQIAEKALKGLRHIEKLISDMLMYSRDQRFEMELVSAADLMAAIATHAIGIEQQVTVQQISPADHSPTIRVNVEALVSVVQNAVDNAIGAGANRIQIYCQDENALVKIYIQDDGPGVPAKNRKEIFEPFVSGRSNGTGLGLAIGRAVCRAHGGDLVLADDDRRQGACFCLALPIMAEDFDEVAELKQAF